MNLSQNVTEFSQGLQQEIIRLRAIDERLGTLPKSKAEMARRNLSVRYEQYQHDPCGYARDVLKMSLTDDQSAMIESVRDNRYTAVKASHAIGKTHLASVAANWWYDCWAEHIVYVTAPNWSQALGLTFKQVKRTRRALSLPGRILDSGRVLDTDKMREGAHFIRALNADTGEGFQGEHSAPILIIMEEAVGVPPYIWEAAGGLMTNPDCFPSGAVVSGAHLEGCSRRWFEGEVVEIRTSRWKTTVTKNHPILTSKGWVPATLLKKSDYVIGCLNPERVSAAIAGDDYQVPTMIEDVAHSFSVARDVFQVRGRTHQFHGDGRDGDVDVVRPAGALRDRKKAAFSQPFNQQRLFGVDFRTLFFGERNPATVPPTVSLAPCSSVSKSGEGTLFLGRHKFKPELVGFSRSSGRYSQSSEGGNDGCVSDSVFAPKLGGGNTRLIPSDHLLGVGRHPLAAVDVAVGSPAPPDAVVIQQAADGLAADSVLVRELISRYPGNVVSDQVLGVRTVPFSGHVYNLQSRLGWFIADNIIAHNCRLLAIANPTDEATNFGQACESAQYNVLSVSALDHPNIAAELQCTASPFPDAVRLQWLFEMLTNECERTDVLTEEAFEFYALEAIEAALKGIPVDANIPRSVYLPTAYFQGRVLGEFPTQADQQVIPRAWLKSQSVLEPEGQPEIGCDAARFGDDRTTIAVRRGACLLSLRELRKMDNLEIETALKDAAREAALPLNLNPKTLAIKIDVTGGLGTGPFDHLLSEGYNMHAVNSSTRANDDEQYRNRRSELWFDTRTRAREHRLDLSRVRVELREKLIKELSAPKYKVPGKKVVEEKAEMKRRLGVSPDLADAVNLAFAYVPPPPDQSIYVFRRR